MSDYSLSPNSIAARVRELKAENKRLKAKIELRDNLIKALQEEIEADSKHVERFTKPE